MFRNILLAIPKRSLGAPQAPASLLSLVWRTRLRRGYLLPYGRCSCTSVQEWGRLLPSKQKFSQCGFCMGIDIFSFAAYNNSTRQATACVCQSVEVRECAGRHCLTELARGVAITSNRSRLQGRKKMLRPSCSRKTAFFFVIEREYG